MVTARLPCSLDPGAARPEPAAAPYEWAESLCARVKRPAQRHDVEPGRLTASCKPSEHRGPRQCLFPRASLNLATWILRRCPGAQRERRNPASLSEMKAYGPSRRAGTGKWEEGCLGRFKDMLVIPSRTSSVREKMFSHFLGHMETALHPRKGECCPSEDRH